MTSIDLMDEIRIKLNSNQLNSTKGAENQIVHECVCMCLHVPHTLFSPLAKWKSVYYLWGGKAFDIYKITPLILVDLITNRLKLNRAQID